jgi:hypothetical protein
MSHLYNSQVETLIASMPKSVQKLKFTSEEISGFEKILVLLLTCTAKHIEFNTSVTSDKEEVLKRYLNADQQSEGNRTRSVGKWKFSVSTNNKILSLQFIGK